MVPANMADAIAVDAHLHIIRDEMDPTRHMGTGEYFTSKAKFRQRTKDIGCVELGNDPSLLKPRKPVMLDRQKRIDDIKRTIEQLRQRG